MHMSLCWSVHNLCTGILLFCVTEVFGNMWRKAAAAAILAIIVGYFYHTNPELPEHVLQYLSLPHRSPLDEPSTPTFEQVISTAWEAIITIPARQWGRVAVG